GSAGACASGAALRSIRLCFVAMASGTQWRRAQPTIASTASTSATTRVFINSSRTRAAGAVALSYRRSQRADFRNHNCGEKGLRNIRTRPREPTAARRRPETTPCHLFHDYQWFSNVKFASATLPVFTSTELLLSSGAEYHCREIRPV